MGREDVGDMLRMCCRDAICGKDAVKSAYLPPARAVCLCLPCLREILHDNQLHRRQPVSTKEVRGRDPFRNSARGSDGMI